MIFYCWHYICNEFSELESIKKDPYKGIVPTCYFCDLFKKAQQAVVKGLWKATFMLGVVYGKNAK